ncbi:MAG: type I pullulanase [Prevotella sp.]
MKVRPFLLVALLLLSGLATAQNVFNEMAYTSSATTFRLFAPRSSKPVVRLYATGEARGEKPLKTIRMKAVAPDRWEVRVKGNLKGRFYTFAIKPGMGETSGVFAKAVGINGDRGAIIDMKQTNPEGWAQDKVAGGLKSAADWVIYEMHVRDYTHAAPGIKHPDKFLGIVEPAMLQHLKDLGVNAVHLLPSFDFASVQEQFPNVPQYNWGYDPKNYNVPEGSYSTDPWKPEVRIREFKTMVKRLHEAGIRVILDVVYNHTFNIKNSNFQLTYPDYFYRKNTDGTYSDGSGCGNETASERPMMRKYMLESVKYWATEYHIDGFRFDLMGIHDIETMNDIRAELNKINPNILVYGEGWSAGSCAYPEEKRAVKAHISQMPGIAAFSDEMRDALRGPFSDDKKGAFLAGITGSEESLKFGIAGAIAHPGVDMTRVNYSKTPWATEPTQMISYVSCHDDMCLVDRLRASIPDIDADELMRLDKLAQTVVFTSQGIPFMLAGEEMLRDKKGVHNSYNSPDSINALNWSNLDRYPQLYLYYKRLIQLRRHHPAFRLGTAELVRKHLEFLPTQECLVGFVLKNHAGGDSWKNIFVFLNGNREAREVTLPAGNYETIVCDGVINEQGLGEEHGGKVMVDGQSALILREKD